jgi:hypothetical protein
MYSCKECGAPATVSNDEVPRITRSCNHTGIVTLNLKVHCVGESSTKEVNPIFAMFHKLGLAILKKLKQ